MIFQSIHLILYIYDTISTFGGFQIISANFYFIDFGTTSYNLAEEHLGKKHRYIARAEHCRNKMNRLVGRYLDTYPA